ncbi:MAG: DNA mismatch repair protein MutS, partial [Chloroflexi bacterium]|nr:DNA mismatch repair protein MutS [Chloroflexota bacterium]
MTSLTPIRQQYLKLKQEHPDAILLFRMGDFYETFDDDARIAARELEIALTSREMGKGQSVPLAGIPYHALDGYLARLVKRGYKVAICEQVGDTSARGLVERQVVRVVTPGTLTEPALLEQNTNNYLAAVVVQDQEAGLAYVDITTSEFATTQLPVDDLPLELERLGASEVLLPEGYSLPSSISVSLVTPLEEEHFRPAQAAIALQEHFGVTTLEAYGCHAMPLATAAAGAIIAYLRKTQKPALERLQGLHTYSPRAFMLLDHQTRRNLELFQAGRWGDASHSLLSTLDLTSTPMGGRLLRKWLSQPLLDLAELERRQDAVQALYTHQITREEVLAALKPIPDLERLLNRIATGVAIPREVVSLKGGLEAVARLKALLDSADSFPSWLGRGLDPCGSVASLVEQALEGSPGAISAEGSIIRQGFSPELDELKTASRNGREYIASLERTERERTGIKSLRVGYNRVFGYYIEVSNPHLSQVPSDYTRRQTLVGGERFITPELKEYESMLLNAQERMEELEATLFRQVCTQIAEYSQAIASTAAAVAHIDVFTALAQGASRYGYVRPQLTLEDTIEIKEGRHPVVERTLPPGSFVPNDTHLSNHDAQIVILTGPNMSGKSTHIRQVALIVLMAQIGSFVPAASATIGLVDRVFTRIGLQDDLSTGQSTFMVEMVETASILHHATPRSLVILDEIGRGTSTYDGLAIARATAEYIHNSPRLGCKTLFATHYHELTQLAQTLPRVRNLSVAAVESE